MSRIPLHLQMFSEEETDARNRVRSPSPSSISSISSSSSDDVLPPAPVSSAAGSSASAPAPPIVRQSIMNNSRAGNLDRSVRNQLNESMQTAVFECIVCLESLDSPATVLEERVVPVIPPVPDAEVIGAEDNPIAGPARGGGTARGRRGGRVARPAIRRGGHTNCDPREIATTPCGHMYHRYCIEKWFSDQGKRTCPSCRKAVTVGKMVRLYPNQGQEEPEGQYDPPTVVVPAAAAAAVVINPVIPIPVIPVPLPANNPDQPLEVPNVNCANLACADLKVLHTTLVSDYNELRERYYTISDDFALRNAEIQSLQESHDRANEQLVQLKAILESSSVASKRRRQH